jgi:hypothetical protein
MKLLKSKNDFVSPYLILKRTWVNIPIRCNYRYLKQKKVTEFYTSFSVSVNDTAETDFGDFRSEYLGEDEAICETFLAC